MKTLIAAGSFLAVFLLMVRAEDFETPLPTDNAQAVALYEASKKGDLAEVRELIGSGAPIDGQIGSLRSTALMAANYKNHLDVLKFLLDYHATIDVVDDQGCTTLFKACFLGHDDCAMALIDAGANVSLGSKFGRTPLMLAANKGSDRVVQDLIDHKAPLDANCDQGPAICWAANANQLSTVKILAAAGANPNLVPIASKSFFYSALDCAAANNNLQMIDYLLSMKADINGAGVAGDTPLMVAADWARPEAMERLLAAGANVNLTNKKGQTALMLGIGRDDLVRTLLAAGADPNITDARGETALTIAGEKGDMDIVQMLKDKGAQKTEIHIIAKADPPEPLPPARAWALCVGAIYMQRGGANPKILGAGNLAANQATMLKRDWKIYDKDSLIQELNELRDHGHHTVFQEEGDKLAQMSDDDFEKELAAHPDRQESLKAVRASSIKWKDRSGLAWDLCRSANIVNAGYTAHYLTEQEAWDRLIEIAKQTQGAFSSWQEMNDNFLDGREIWANQRDPRFDACSKLLLDPTEVNSPWNQNPWKTNLSGN